MPITTFMLIDGRNGGSTDPNHRGWFEISSMQFGAGVGVDVLAGTASAPSFSQVAVQLAGAAAGLLADLTAAISISSIRIEQVDGTGAVVYDLRLGNVLLTGDSLAGAGGSSPSTSLSLQYGQIGFTSPTSSFGYDLAAGAPMPVASIPAPVVAGPDGLETAAATHYYLVFSDSAGPVGGASKGWIEISSLQFGADRSSPIGGGSSITSLEPVSVSFSGLSTQLLTTLTARDKLDAVQIQGVDGKGSLVYDLRLGDVVLSSNDVSGGGDTPSTSLTLAYDRIGLITAGSSFGYDRTPGVAIDPTTLPALTKSGPDIVDSSAVTKYFMAIDGFNGGSVNGVSKGWFEIDSLQLGVGAAVSIASGAPVASLPAFKEAVVSLAGLSPALFSELAARDGVASVQVRGLNATNDVVYDLRLGEVLITGNSISSAAGDTPSSSLNLNYGRIGLTTTEGSFGYDLVNQTGIAANAIAAPVLSTIDVLETAPVAHYYLLINDGNVPVSGTSKAWFEIDVLQWGAGLSVGALPDRTPGPASLSDLTVVFKGTSPDLLRTLTLGNNLNSIQVQGVDSKGALVYDLRLADVYLTGDSLSASSEAPYTSLSFAYDRIGLITPGGNSFGYDRTPGVAIDPNTLPTLIKEGPDYIESAAVTKYFMAIDGYNGGSVNATSKGWFEIDSLVFGAGAAVAPGGTPSAADFGEVLVSLTGVSPALLGELATGDGVRSVWLRGVDTATNSVVYDLRLGNASLTANEFRSEGSTLLSSLSFSYGSVGLSTPGRSFGYDLGSGSTIAPSAIPTPATSGPDVLETGAVAHYYLLIDNGSGPPTGDSKGRIEIDSVQLRTGNSPGAASAPQLSELQMELQGVSPILLGKLATGTQIASVQVQGVDGKGAVVYDLRLGDALISGYSVSASDGAKASLSIAYDRIGIITPSGGFGYDVVNGVAISPSSIPAPTVAVAPVVTVLSAAVSEDGPSFSQNLLAGASDANPGTTLTVENLDASVTTSGGRVLTLGSDYTLTGSTLALTTAGFNKFDSLAAAQTDLAVVHFRVSDGGLSTPNTLTLTVNGVDDKAVLGSAAVSVAETNAPITTGGTLTIFDVDGPAAFVAQPATAGKYGAFTIAANGIWTYKANLAFDYLNPGDSLTDTVQVTSTDGGTSSVSVTITGTAEVGTVRLGDAPTAQSGTGGQWAQAWTQTGYVITQKADAANASEPWSAVRLNAVSPQLLSGGDIFAGDLGVSGQSAATSTVRQEIDGREVLRIALPSSATSVTVGLTRLFTNDDGSGFSESGLLRLLNASGQVVAEKAFWADSANGLKTVTLDAASGFVAMELLAGAYNGTGNFVYGGYSSADGAFGSPIFNDAAGLHGSDFLLDRVEFSVPLVGTLLTADPGALAPG